MKAIEYPFGRAQDGGILRKSPKEKKGFMKANQGGSVAKIVRIEFSKRLKDQSDSRTPKTKAGSFQGGEALLDLFRSHVVWTDKPIASQAGLDYSFAETGGRSTPSCYNQHSPKVP